jgi:4-amino-4-deoxychorismate lyase
MSLLFETIRIENGILMYPGEHEKRMFRSRNALFGTTDLLFVDQVVRIPGGYTSGTVRCRIDYGIKIDSVSFAHYMMKPLKKFQVVVDGGIEYPYKFSDRSGLESLLKKKNRADEIILVKHGLITDTSFSNLVFYNGRDWITPSRPLFKGTCRERLIREGKILERRISLMEINSFRGFKIINAMIYPEDTEIIPTDACILP